jgi:hypothetical protein
MSTQQPMATFAIWMRKARTIPQMNPITVPMIRLSPETATVIHRPYRKKGRL